ncbi:MAG: hypothetical protein K2J20_05985 [Bacilli bacterium]|nr:hypothetical protein [Bacilli bacterium]
MANDTAKEQYHTKLVSSEYPENIQASISALQESFPKYFGINKFYENSFGIETFNPLTLLRLQKLATNHILLEKVYDDKAISSEGMNVIARYIHYINVETGIEYVEAVDTLPNSDDTIINLRTAGYQAIETTPLIAHLSTFDKNGKPTIVNSNPTPNR